MLPNDDLLSKHRKRKQIPVTAASSLSLFLCSFPSSLHLQLHGGGSHLRLPGRPLQQKGHPELRHFLLVSGDSVQLLHRQRGTTSHTSAVAEPASGGAAKANDSALDMLEVGASRMK